MNIKTLKPAGFGLGEQFWKSGKRRHETTLQSEVEDVRRVSAANSFEKLDCDRRDIDEEVEGVIDTGSF